jgi:hypothetical protein
MVYLVRLLLHILFAVTIHRQAGGETIEKSHNAVGVIWTVVAWVWAGVTQRRLVAWRTLSTWRCQSGER